MDKRDKDREDTHKSDRGEQTQEILKSKLPYIVFNTTQKN